MGGTRHDGSTLLSKDGAPVYSAFFQQSSFGTFALTQERWAVKVRNDAPLEQLGPLACSGQTGAGAVLNVMKPDPGDSIAVFGVGAVGLSALMAAKIAGCDPIVAVDVHEHRLALAHELGATASIDHKSCADVVGEYSQHHRRRRALRGRTRRPCRRCSARPSNADAGRQLRRCSAARRKAPMRRSKCRFCSRAASSAAWCRATACRRNSFQSSSISWSKKFPIEHMITFYDFADINLAAQESSAGITIKPVLRMPITSPRRAGRGRAKRG